MEDFSSAYKATSQLNNADRNHNSVRSEIVIPTHGHLPQYTDRLIVYLKATKRIHQFHSAPHMYMRTVTAFAKKFTYVYTCVLCTVALQYVATATSFFTEVILFLSGHVEAFK